MAYGQRGGNVLSGILASISFASFGILLNQGALAVNSQIDRVQLAVPVSRNVNTTYDSAHLNIRCVLNASN